MHGASDEFRPIGPFSVDWALNCQRRREERPNHFPVAICSAQRTRGEANQGRENSQPPLDHALRRGRTGR